MAASLRDEVVGFVGHWAARSGVAVHQLLAWLGLPPGKYHAWQGRRGWPNRHNAPLPMTFWLRPWEREAIVALAQRHPREGYRRLA